MTAEQGPLVTAMLRPPRLHDSCSESPVAHHFLYLRSLALTPLPCVSPGEGVRLCVGYCVSVSCPAAFQQVQGASGAPARLTAICWGLSGLGDIPTSGSSTSC